MEELRAGCKHAITQICSMFSIVHSVGKWDFKWYFQALYTQRSCNGRLLLNPTLSARLQGGWLLVCWIQTKSHSGTWGGMWAKHAWKL